MLRCSSLMSSPWIAPPSSTILNPLNSGGLWEPVTWRPPSTVSVWVAKYRAGVGTEPTNRANAPASSIPDSTLAARSAPEGRLSRPTAMRGARPSRAAAKVANAFPIACATAPVSWSPTVPRMAYSRKMVAGTCMGTPGSAARRLPGRGGRGGRGGRVRRHRRGRPDRSAARPGDVEQAVRPHAEEEEPRDRSRDDGGSEPAEPHAGVRLLGGLGLHVHRHDHR